MNLHNFARLTLHGIMLFYLFILLTSGIISNNINYFQLYDDLSVKKQNYQIENQLYFRNIYIADIDENSRWLIYKKHLYGKLTVNSHTVYINYACDKDTIESYDDMTEFSKKLESVGLKFSDIDNGEGLLDLKNNRVYEPNCR